MVDIVAATAIILLKILLTFHSNAKILQTHLRPELPHSPAPKTTYWQKISQTKMETTLMDHNKVC